MSEVKKIATRDSYGAALVELAKDHPNVVVLDADLAAATKTGVFKKAYPDRHFDCGIAESNMMATAAGMAAQFVKEYSPKSLRNREGFWYNRRKPPREAPSWKSTPKTPAAKQWLLT